MFGGMTLRSVLVVFVLGLGLGFEAFANTPVFQTTEGSVLGRTTASGVFYPNIPYAKPPVGDLRWKAPRKPSVRSTPWDGSRLDVRCAQVGAFFSGTTDDSQFGRLVGSEDCLYLNVWAPRATSGAKRPVFVWFHGGSNRQGYANDPLYDGAELARRADVIVVTVNYRLGFFGALHHEALETNDRSDSSGNYVTLDGIRALEWIRSNVDRLGGDVDRLTIAGESAGCVNVWGLLQSPLAKGLFARAYCASGFPNGYPPMIARRAADDMIERALVLKGRAKDLDAAAELLRKTPKEDVRKFLYGLSTEDVLSVKPGYFPIQHVSDGHVLPAAGVASISLMNFNSVPMIVSTTGDEGSFFYLRNFSGLSYVDFWKVMNGRLPPAAIEKLVASERFDEFDAKRDRYTYGLDQLVDSVLMSAQLSAPVYRMRWHWKALGEPWGEAFGAAHGFDLAFLFRTTNLGSRHFFKFLEKDLADPATVRMADTFTAYLKGFLHDGKPAEPKGAPAWHRWYGGLPNTLVLSREETAEKLYYFDPLFGTYSLTRSIIELSRAQDETFTSISIRR